MAPATRLVGWRARVEKPNMACGKRQRIWLTAVAAIAFAGLLSLLAPNRSWDQSIPLFLIVGTVFGQASLAAGWFVLGPYSLASRFSLSAAWVAALVLCFGWDMGGATAPHELDLLLTFAVAVPSQWALVAIPLSLVAGCSGLRLDTGGSCGEPRTQQIGIREALFLTGVVAIVLGGTRYRAGDLRRAAILWEYVFVYASLVVGNAVLAWPLLFAMLGSRGWLPKLVYSLTAPTAVCILEFCFLCYWIPRFSIPIGAFWPVVIINVSQSLWIVVATTMLRLGGFALTSSRSRSLVAADAAVER